MNAHQIKQIIHSHLKDLRNNAQDITDSFDKEAIHDFRVEAKKIRSFLRLMASQNDHFPTGYHGQFKDVYHTAGFMRDKQLLIDMLTKEQDDIPPFKNWLVDQIKEQQDCWSQLPVKKAIKKLIDKTDDLPYNDVEKQTLEQFFSAGVDTIKRVVTKDLVSDEELHEARKKLKDMMYISALCEKEWKAGNELIQVFAPDKIVQLSTIIGDYNDQRVALDILREYLDVIPFTEKKAPVQLKDKWEAEKKVQKEKLLIALHDFIGQ